MKTHAIVLTLVSLGFLAAPPAHAQQPAQYQLIRVKYRLLDRNGRPLTRASISARLDSGSSRAPSDRTLRTLAGSEEFVYSLDDPGFIIFSNQQYADEAGMTELPVIVYANRSEPIDYELSSLYGVERTNRVAARDRKAAFTLSDAGSTRELRLDAVGGVPSMNYLIAAGLWLGATIMGGLLFFRGVYRSLLAGGRSIELSRALCWSGFMLITLVALGLAYWLFLPHIVNLYVLTVFLFAIWFLHLLFTVLPKRA
ncbi:MAG: hypothetical protein KIT09_00670 [Bryobacteraceae bacterium]|nr:hypothetical protein [Bryobacteraceae bacterium]